MFVKGKSGNPAGRPKGAISSKTMTAKEAVEAVFDILQMDPKHSLEAFAKKYPRDYYQIWAKLLPLSLKADIRFPEPIKIYYAANSECLPIGTNPEGDAGILGE